MNDVIYSDEHWMREALKLAELAAAEHEVPVGAVVVRDNKILGSGFNTPISGCDPTAHAEITALRQAAKNEHNYRLPDATLYVTIEPCTMCLGAIMHARVARVVYGATEPKAGVIYSNPVWQQGGFFNHQVEWCGGVLANEATALIQQFFKQRREAKKQLKRLAGGDENNVSELHKE
ncbi:tRNA adenosine(34) deaminase TadA [Saccharophagus degradans]|uniref:tRNA adenosine(34) deaminase TadA n=1 Tax=Saccharophagus degradans TaxID=86304 RepID=UPI003A806F6D